MKTFFPILLAVISCHVAAHSHGPQRFGGKNNPDQAVTFTGLKNVPITVGNLNDFPQQYLITVNDLPLMETSFIAKNNSQIVHVPVRLKTIGKVETLKICSTSIATQESAFSTRICTRAKLLWVKP
ncbi:hypothetical protein [uncultured Ferrimonas sp.]|uniref:hypothetical protein n=1 Tax=uncultured Ferrimonas sp. TaxID=432640 RepID=UPI002616EB72|nr:hypothetical protein [uncultured Ferrimonas sp.]